MGVPVVPFYENPIMLGLVADVAVVTNTQIAGMIGNGLSGTMAFGAGTALNKPLQQVYQDAVDYAILQVRSGTTDYWDAMRTATKTLSDNGLKVISYDNIDKRAYHRRLDSSVLNAFRSGMGMLSAAQNERLREQIGGDGYEINVHGGCAEDHLYIQGKQYSLNEYEKLNNGLKRKIGTLNCNHRAYPIILGLSPPTYTESQLIEIIKQECTTKDFEGRAYTPYQAEQRQREFELALRREKDRANAFKASGDKKSAERTAKAKTTSIRQKYLEFSDAVGLSEKKNCAAVSGYTRGINIK
ncbi:hypothetical protein AGMMS49975_10880 [Clostridia bacterium]|nr:hypothetical protein AGMMS49975_10880 [Clostridia bacterium]